MAPQTSSMSSNSSHHTPSRSRNILTSFSPSATTLLPHLPRVDHSTSLVGVLATRHPCSPMSACVELYRTNTKKSQDPTTQFEFTVFMIDTSKLYHIPAPTPGSVTEVEKAIVIRKNCICPLSLFITTYHYLCPFMHK